MKIKEVYDYYGSWKNFYTKVKLCSSGYLYWRRCGYIPYSAQILIEKETKGKLVAKKEDGLLERKQRAHQFKEYYGRDR